MEMGRESRGNFQRPGRPGCILLVFLALLLSGPVAAAPGAEPLKVCLLLEHGGKSPWNEALQAGMERAAQEHGASARVMLAPPGPGQREIFRQAARDSDMVLLASAGLHELLRDEAGNFRKRLFGCIDTPIRAKNIMSVSFADEQSSFLAGALAAMLTAKPGLAGSDLGWIVGVESPIIDSMLAAFGEGARLVRPEITVTSMDIGSFTDEAAAAAAATQLLAAGCGVIVPCAGAANAGAVRALAGKPCLLVSMETVPDPQLSGQVAAAIVKRADLAAYDLVSAAATGRFRGSSTETRGLDKAGTFLAGPAAALATPDAVRRLGELETELKNGGIRLKSLRRRTLCDDSCFR